MVSLQPITRRSKAYLGGRLVVRLCVMVAGLIGERERGHDQRSWLSTRYSEGLEVQPIPGSMFAHSRAARLGTGQPIPGSLWKPQTTPLVTN